MTEKAKSQEDILAAYTKEVMHHVMQGKDVNIILNGKVVHTFKGMKPVVGIDKSDGVETTVKGYWQDGTLVITDITEKADV